MEFWILVRQNQKAGEPVLFLPMTKEPVLTDGDASLKVSIDMIAGAKPNVIVTPSTRNIEYVDRITEVKQSNLCSRIAAFFGGFFK